MMKYTDKLNRKQDKRTRKNIPYVDLAFFSFYFCAIGEFVNIIKCTQEVKYPQIQFAPTCYKRHAEHYNLAL